MDVGDEYEGCFVHVSSLSSLENLSSKHVLRIWIC